MNEYLTTKSASQITLAYELAAVNLEVINDELEELDRKPAQSRTDTFRKTDLLYRKTQCQAIYNETAEELNKRKMPLPSLKSFA